MVQGNRLEGNTFVRGAKCRNNSNRYPNFLILGAVVFCYRQLDFGV